MLLGSVGQTCWQVPQPVQPCSCTVTFPSINSSAAAPTGHFSTHSLQSWPLVRTQVLGNHSAVPMSMSYRGTAWIAPLGQTCMHARLAQTTQACSLGSMYG